MSIMHYVIATQKTPSLGIADGQYLLSPGGIAIRNVLALGNEDWRDLNLIPGVCAPYEIYRRTHSGVMPKERETVSFERYFSLDARGFSLLHHGYGPDDQRPVLTEWAQRQVHPDPERPWISVGSEVYLDDEHLQGSMTLIEVVGSGNQNPPVRLHDGYDMIHVVGINSLRERAVERQKPVY